MLFLLFTTLFIACDYYPFKKGKTSNYEIDTVINYDSVDVYPMFNECMQVSVKSRITCFREQVHKRITTDLEKHRLITNDSIKELILIDLLIDKNGSFKIKNLSLSETIKTQFPQLEDNIKKSVVKLPKVVPALKRGIPVTVEYQLPITISNTF